MVVLSCAGGEVVALSSAIAERVRQQDTLAIHNIARVSSRHPARLVVCSASPALNQTDGEFIWEVGIGNLPNVEQKLHALVDIQSGHQYFGLTESNVTLMVSVGEYADDWWQRNA